MSNLEQRITETLTAHQRMDSAGCLCGWAELGHPHPGHQTSMLASIIREAQADLTERNRRLANQIVGLTDRVNDSISEIVRKAKAEALREAADSTPIEWDFPPRASALQIRPWLRARADQVVAP